jgi:hypothetical protein
VFLPIASQLVDLASKHLVEVNRAFQLVVTFEFLSLGLEKVPHVFQIFDFHPKLEEVVICVRHILVFESPQYIGDFLALQVSFEVDSAPNSLLLDLVG